MTINQSVNAANVSSQSILLTAWGGLVPVSVGIMRND